ncbi:hypothetical protein OSH39_10375 [Mycobacterium ulcerans]|nr:hypothetical protein [Mycobacterium ulcerans]ABL03170.1 hypothetical secreted protein [Mycobacterium ulcerans Agy99]MEB3905381.1 hypothetical protein [Mycobacterium ulcerans]MEB3909593.1 hypothetical protein [Mycobacterium ulcerans]MEB3919823.1 hypothetical protein [Mycobacterium ulcerans]MEB3923894.1 hypothetical protein [Mycobacterium ulcerans]
MRFPAAVLAIPTALLTVCAISALPAVFPPATHAAAAFGPLAPPNPFMAPNGLASMHNDAGSADAGPLPGPGARLAPIFAYPLLAACPSITQGTDGLVLALCTNDITQAPIVYLIDPGGLVPHVIPLASLGIAKGGLLGGVYAYLDNNNQLVMIDGTNHLLRIAHAKDSKGCWQLSITESTDVSSAIPAGDQSVGVVPDYLGNVWFATGSGVVGVAKVGSGVASVQLDPGEQVANSISASPANRVGVATTAALYELNLDGVGNPQVLWRQPYDRGPARKPGQLSWGTGSTPTYFGPTGADYLTIVDNADPLVHALIYESGTGNLICQQPVLTQGGPGSENSPIGAGTSTFIASTYGYPYPAVPAGAGPAVPPTAPFVGGMTRVDVEPTGCRTVWDSSTRSAALPHLSIADGLIYTITRIGLDNTTPLDVFAFAVIDPNNGRVLLQQPRSATILSDPIQTACMVLMDNKIMQGNITGIGRIG